MTPPSHAPAKRASAWPGALLLTAALLSGGCAARVVKTPVFQDNGVEVFLRARTRGGKPVDQGYSQPVTISAIRVTNILARIDVRGADPEKEPREPAIPTGVLYAVGEGVSKALAKADSSQQVVVMATERKKSLGIFTNDYLTSLILWMKDDHLFVFLGALGEVESRDPRDKPREPEVDHIESKQRVLGGDGYTVQGPRLIAADWRADTFRDVSAIRVRPSGEVVRRTILMESPADANPAEAPGPAPPPEGLSPEALRALADLEESRRRGQLSESQYQQRRREILSGKLPSSEPAPAATTGNPQAGDEP
jgi:hypothetical protein